MGNTKTIVTSIPTGIPALADMLDGELQMVEDTGVLYQRIDVTTLVEFIDSVGADARDAANRLRSNHTGAYYWPYVTKSSNYTITTTDGIIDVTSNSVTISLPTAVGNDGIEFIIKNSGTGIVTVDGFGTETTDDELTRKLSPKDSITIVSNGANWIIINSNMGTITAKGFGLAVANGEIDGYGKVNKFGEAIDCD